MKEFYEATRDNISTPHVLANANYEFKPHFHSHIEVLIVKKGKCPISYNGQNYVVSDGQTAFFDSFEFHGYEKNTPCDGQSRVLVIPLSYAKNFLALKKDKGISNFLVSDEKLCEDLIQVVDNYVLSQKSAPILTAGIELFLAILSQKLVFSEQTKKGENNLVKEILLHLNSHFKEDVSLPTVAKKFGYTEAHVSRTFSKYVKTSIKDYVNDLRIDYVLNNINLGVKKNVTELVFESGFKSMQTYYRNLAKKQRVIIK